MKVIPFFTPAQQSSSRSANLCAPNYKAFFLLLVFLFDTFYPLSLSAASRQASPPPQEVPVAERALDMVDLYTGDLNYSVPLMMVPGPNGENVDLTAYYTAGIQVNQSAGMLGLGWTLNTGEITRQVIGAPDDFAGQSVTIVQGMTPAYGGDLVNVFTYGCFYYNKLNSASSYSSSVLPGVFNLYTTDHLAVESEINGVNASGKTYLNIVNGIVGNVGGANVFPRYFSKPTAPFAMPAYDNYFVSGPGLSGKIKPYIFSTQKPNNKLEHPVLYKGLAFKSDIRQNRKVEFHFEGGSHASAVNLPHKTSTNRLKSGTYVKYYTNAEINNPSNLYDNTTGLGFLDYRLAGSTRRPASDFDANGIGGIAITNPDGFTYHYSLPVRANYCADKSFSNPEMTSVVKSGYAISWKLTAITGPDYKDLNNNKMVDLGDLGYWVQYKYSLWAGDFMEASLLYGLQNKNTGRLTTDRRHELLFKTGDFSLNETRSQKYYLDHIRTSTHTAYFIKDIRLDEHSAENGRYQGIKVSPSLKLKRIVLLKNEHRHLIENGSQFSSQGLHSGFSPSLISNLADQSLIHIDKYLSQKTWIDKASLKSVEFMQDYSLCKKYHSNINNNFGHITTSRRNKNPLSGISYINWFIINRGSDVIVTSIDPALFTTSDLANSGKLTLNQIRTYEDGGIELFNPYAFDYRQSNADKNPDYDPAKKDIWGYYKSDHSGLETNTGYPTCKSALYVDAWSLWKITLPAGATIEMAYESDTYSSEGFMSKQIVNTQVFGSGNTQAAQNSIRRPHYIYPIAAVTHTAVVPEVTAWENDDKGYVEAHVFVASDPVTPNQCENRGAGLFYAIPIPVSFYSKYFPETVKEVPEFFIGWNGPSTGASSPHNGRWPDFHTYYSDQTQPFYHQPYLKNKWYGYELQAATWLFGGGLRVKSITFKDSDSGLSYTEEFTYEGGYCAAPPKPHTLGLAGGNTFYTLWNNTFNYIPYINLTNVGYTRVETRNRNMFSESNGYTVSHFRNAQFQRNPLTIIPQNGKRPVPNPGFCNDGGINIWEGPSPYPIIYKDNYSYSLTAVFSEQEYKTLGLLERVEKYNNNDPKPIYKKEFDYHSYSITESYDVSFLNYEKEVRRPARQPVLAAQEVVELGNTHCKEFEYYEHFSGYVSVGHYLKKETETIDGITTTTDYGYDPDTGLLTSVMVTSPTDGKLLTTYQYAYQNPVHPLGMKYDNEAKQNRLNEWVFKRKYKGGANSIHHNTNQFYLIDEAIHDQYGLRNVIREFDPATSPVNPEGCYYVNTSSIYTSRELIPFHSYEGLFGAATSGTVATLGPDPEYHRLSGLPTLFSKNGKIIESYGLNDRYSAVKMGYNHTKQLASIHNARYASFGFTSFEDTVTVAPGIVHFGGEFTKGEARKAAPGIVKPHSGEYVAQVLPQNTGPSLLCRLFDLDRTYEAKVWVHKSSPPEARLKISLKGVNQAQVPINSTVNVDKSDAANIQVGDWILMTCRLSVPADVYVQNPSNPGYLQTPDLSVSLENLSTTKSAFFDDLMFAPIDAPVTGQVFDLRTGRLTAQLDPENFASYYYYDAAGRIISTYKETRLHGVVKILEQEYNNCRSSAKILDTNPVLPHVQN